MSAIADIADKVHAGERLSREDGERLFAHPNLLEVGALANTVRERMHGDKTFYVVNRHLNYSNVCTLSCKFCAFYRRDGDDGAYTWAVDQMLVRAEDMVESGATEIHIVGGLHPDLQFDYYLEMLRGLKGKFPGIHLKGFTANEIWHFANKFDMSYAEVFQALKAAGLDSLPGGGAEIFHEDVRSKICPGKEPAEEWLKIHKTAHETGLKSTATMLYGHVETEAQRVDHMLRLRDLQDETGGLTCFIPLSFHPENTQMEEIQQAGGTTDLRIVAVSRLMLDNIPHIKTYWIMTGVKTAQIALQFGADDLDGTVIEEKITHMAGGRSPEFMSEGELCRLIREAGRTPVRRDSIYNEFDAPADKALAASS